jgi:hypothetical protein
MPGTGSGNDGQLAPAGRVAEEIAKVRGALAQAPDEATATELVAARMAQYVAANPDATILDPRQLHRLVLWALDPDGMTWMAQAGLLATDSCGYPVAGGYYEVSADLAAEPVAVAHPDAVAPVMGRAAANWGISFVRTGAADLELPWREYLREASERV